MRASGDSQRAKSCSKKSKTIQIQWKQCDISLGNVDSLATAMSSIRFQKVNEVPDPSRNIFKSHGNPQY